jgi:hypothetical protein
MKARLPLLLGMAGLLLLAVLATRGGSAVPRGKGLLLDGPARAQVSQPPQPVLHGDGRLSPVTTVSLSVILGIILVIYLGAVAIVVVLIASIRWRRRVRQHRIMYDTGTDDGAENLATGMVLLRGARRAAQLLRQRPGGPPADAVQQAWLALEEAAADSGTARRPDQTATEFTAAVLAAHEVDIGALDTLRDLYHRARFAAPGAVTDADADIALAALDRIIASLAARMPARPKVSPGTP